MKKTIWFIFAVLIFCNDLYSSDGSYRTSEDTIPPRLDTHIHLYDTRREGSSVFLDPTFHKKIYFPHFGDTFADTANPAGVNYAIVVEASMRREDNFWLRDLVDTSENLLAFTANLDPRDPYCREDLDNLGKSNKFRGIRIRPKTHLDISDPAIIRSFAELARRGLVLELGGAGVDPAVVAGIAARYPNMNIIMNHLAGGGMQGDQVKPDNWEDRLAVFASEPNVYCKISALYTLSGRDPAPVNEVFYRPLIDPVVDAFGPERVMFGSNWTLSDMRGSYKEMIGMLDQYCEYRTDLSPGALYYENAIKAYGIIGDTVEHPGNGTGLFKSYWEGADGGRGWFQDSICGFTGAVVNEYHASGTPGCGLDDSFWNIRWKGYLEPIFTGTHTFYLTVNDMARLWIDDQLIIDSWTAASTEKSYKASMNLVSGKRVIIRIDYANLTDDGYVKLEWESGDLPREVIPAEQLYLPEFATAQTTFESGDQRGNYPNPACDYIHFSRINSSNNHVKIRDASGKVKIEKEFSGEQLRVEVDHWLRGIYFVEIINDNSRIVDKLIIL